MRKTVDIGEKTGIIIVNWNGHKDTIACIDSIKKSIDINYTIIVVDNASTDGSFEKIKEAHPDIEVVQSGKNRGFGGGNNYGVDYAHALGLKSIWLLNNDTLVYSDTIGKLRAALAAGEGNLLGCSIYEMSDPSQVQSLGVGRVDFLLGRVSLVNTPDQLGAFDYVTGTSLMLLTDVYQRLGGFDETFFMYWEDTDLSFRAVRGGFRLNVVTDARILHKTSASSQIKSVRADDMFTASSVKFFRRYSGNPGYKVGILLRIAKRILEKRFTNIPVLARHLISHKGV